MSVSTVTSRRAYVSLGLSAIAVSALALGGVQSSAKPAQIVPPPPISNDLVSWQQFILAVTPSGVPGKVAYETFASDQDIYVSNPCAPTKPVPGCNVPAWPSATSKRAPKSLQRSLLGMAHMRATAALRGARRGFGVQVIGPAQGCGSPSGLGGAAAGSGFPKTGCVGEEVRRDRATYDYLVGNGLWSSAGISQYYATGQPVTAPWNALEVKADWIPVTTLATWLGKPASFVTANFYTSSANVGKGPATAYAMTSMHISVKTPGFPDWIWADFENAYTPGRCDLTGCSDSFGATTPTTPANAKPWGQYGACPKSANVTAMMQQANVGAVFANYCLSGSQSTFGTAANPTLLGSSVVETLNANVPLAQSSCISCHAGAAFNASGPANVGSPIGPNAPAKGYTAYDFMWGLLFAQ